MLSAKKIHFIGVGGIGMSGLAALSMAKGFEVSGSDLQTGSVVKNLQSGGMKFTQYHSRENITVDTIVVHSSAICNDNPELQRARELQLDIWHRSDLLAWFARSFDCSVAIAGTHGKTTTTSLLGWLTHSLGRSPTIVSGGIMSNFNANLAIGSGDTFIAESDESDRSFLKYHPKYAIVTNIDRDHLEMYDSFAELKSCFLKFINQATERVFLNGDDPAIKEILQDITVPVTLYGLSPENHFYCEGLVFSREGNRFCLKSPANTKGVLLQSPLFGAHNVYNCLAALAFCEMTGADIQALQPFLPEFTGVERRFQILGYSSRHCLISDYAHHPTEISGTLKVASDIFPADSMTIVIEPHRYSRIHLCGDEIVEVLKAGYSDKQITVLPIYGAGEKERYGMKPPAFYELCKSAGLNVFYAGNFEDLTKELEMRESNLRDNSFKAYLFLGAGLIHQWATSFENYLQRSNHPEDSSLRESYSPGNKIPLSNGQIKRG